MTCEVCGGEFTPKPGSTGRFCSRECYRLAGTARRKPRPRPTTKCEKCGKSFTAKLGTAGRFCSHPCYAASMAAPYVSGVAHRPRKARNHPIAPPSGTVAIARLVLYDKIGPGDHPCHWCGFTLRWTNQRTPDAIFADHVDHDPTNDAPDNLVPSCHRCNAHRTRLGDRRLIQPGEPTLLINGKPTRAVERNCEYCGEAFLALPAFIRAGKGRFCSRDCAYANRRGRPRN